MHTMPDRFFGETTPQSSTSERWVADGPPIPARVPARDGKDRPTLRLRSACDFCHSAKVKCSGGTACDRCLTQDLPCTYSVAMRAGKPKGSCNRKTLDKHARIRQQHAARQASLDWNWSTPATSGTSLNEATWVTGINGVLLGMGLQMQDQNTPGFDHLNYASDPQSQCVLSPDGMPEQGCCSIPAPTEEPSFEAHFASLYGVNHEISNSDVAGSVCADVASLPLSPSETPDASGPTGTEEQEACACFKEQTDSLNMLYSLHRMAQCQAQGNASPPHGMMRLYEYIVADIQCNSGTLASRERTPLTSENLNGEQSHMSCRLGEYEASPEESVAIRRLVVRRALQKGRETLAALKMLTMGESCRVDGGMVSGSQSRNSLSTLNSFDMQATAKTSGTKSQDDDLLQTGLTATDTTYLQQVVCRGDAVLDVFLRTVCSV
ncbi:C6 finger domain transcription factor tcpZ [Diaporthe amygdali]|uniref:C6 finger domain transcription factor tcpZ n=1 Tax=Phomopsis amygdali TaxID=1214568 RepID=UPI0022FDCA88|nr:C6 finger domain transcription factor tcpZ [Diaporthe amygdali]KAJ0120707.1 C6 finger domain transcription factor tcpZ [Diaporthe amygdali]